MTLSSFMSDERCLERSVEKWELDYRTGLSFWDFLYWEAPGRFSCSVALLLPILSGETMWSVLLCAKEFELSNVRCRPSNLDLRGQDKNNVPTAMTPHHQFVIATKRRQS